MSSINYSNITIEGPHITMIGNDCVATGIAFDSTEQIGKVAIQLLNDCDNTSLKIVMANIPEGHKEKTMLAQKFEEKILSAIKLKKPEKTKIICKISRPFSFYMEVSMQQEV